MSSSSVDLSEDVPILMDATNPASDEIPSTRPGSGDENGALLLMADTAALFQAPRGQDGYDASVASDAIDDDRGRTAQSFITNEYEERGTVIGSTLSPAPSPVASASFETSQQAQGLRTSSRIKKTPCPMCGQYFFDLEKHAATCEGPTSPSGSMAPIDGTNDGGTTANRKPKRSRSSGPSPSIAETTIATTEGLAVQASVLDGDTSNRSTTFSEQPILGSIRTGNDHQADQQHHEHEPVQIIMPPSIPIIPPSLPKPTSVITAAPSVATKRKRIVPNKSAAIPSMPPPLNAPPPTLDANKDVIQRERALFAAAAAAAAAAAGAGPSSSGDVHQSASALKAKNVELVEVEPGVTIFVSEHPMREGQGQGSEYTLRTQISWLVEELHSVRESDSFVRVENERLRKGMEDVLARIEEQRKGMEELEDLRLELLAKQEEAESLRAQVEADRAYLGEQEKRMGDLQEELRAVRGELSSTKSELSKTKGQATRAKNEQAKTKKDLDDTLVRLDELGKELVAKSGEVAQLTGELTARSQDVEDVTAQLASKTNECEESRLQLEVKSKLAGDLSDQLQTKCEELNATKKDLETTKAELAKMKAELEQASLIHKGPVRRDSLSPLSPDDDLEMLMTRPFDPLEMEAQMIALMAPVDDGLTRDADEYLQLLTQWLVTHKNALPSSAVAVFHGTKPRAKELWQAIASRRVPAMTIREFLGEFGASKSIAFDESTSTIRLVIESLKADEEERNKQKAFLDRVVSWLEEKNGMATWTEFLETFPSFSKKDRADWLAMVKTSHDELVFAPNDSLIIFRPMADRAFTSLFREYLRNLKGNKVVPATRFAHFVETFPGALQIRDRLSPNEAKLASLAKKFPDKVHFWRDGDAAMCCLAEDREGIEQERAEKRRKEAEAKAELERTRLQQEKREQEEKASMEWERRKREMMMMASPPSTPAETPTQLPPPLLVQSVGSKRQRWGEPVPPSSTAGNRSGAGGSNAAPTTIPDQSLPPPSYNAQPHVPPSHANNPPSQPPPAFGSHPGPSYDAYTPEMSYYHPPQQQHHPQQQQQQQQSQPQAYRPPPLIPHLSGPSPMSQPPPHPHYAPPPQFPQPPPPQQQEYPGAYPYQSQPLPPPPHPGYGGYGYNNDGRG